MCIILSAAHQLVSARFHATSTDEPAIAARVKEVPDERRLGRTAGFQRPKPDYGRGIAGLSTA